jgi:hypothetical protein
VAALVLLLTYSSCRAQAADDRLSCPVEIQSLKDAAPFSSLIKGEQTKVLHALSDDIAEMAEIDIASSESSHAAYRKYFISHLEFKAVPGANPAERLLLIRYHSNTMCGSNENCPVWIVRLTHSSAQTMVPWQEELGTSAGGSWGVGVLPPVSSDYPELMLLTHLSSVQTGLACYRESKHHYLRVDCSPGCAQLFEHRRNDGDGP